MKLDATYVKRITDSTGFDTAQLEKVIRLRQLLIEFRKHPFLRERLVLKGGTAVNLFYLELARLSVDIDLNYIGQLDREEMQRERPEIVHATEEITKALGYKVQKSADRLRSQRMVSHVPKPHRKPRSNSDSWVGPAELVFALQQPNVLHLGLKLGIHTQLQTPNSLAPLRR